MKKLLLSHINSICVCMIMLAVGCGKRTVQEYDERVMEIERVVSTLRLTPQLVLVIEGTHGLNPMLTSQVPYS